MVAADVTEKAVVANRMQADNIENIAILFCLQTKYNKFRGNNYESKMQFN